MPAARPTEHASPNEQLNRETLAALTDRIDRLETKLDAFLETPIPSPAAVDGLRERFEELEAVVLDQQRPQEARVVPLPSKPPTPLCGECGAVEGVHFDDCSQYVERGPKQAA